MCKLKDDIEEILEVRHEKDINEQLPNMYGWGVSLYAHLSNGGDFEIYDHKERWEYNEKTKRSFRTGEHDDNLIWLLPHLAARWGRNIYQELEEKSSDTKLIVVKIIKEMRKRLYHILDNTIDHYWYIPKLLEEVSEDDPLPYPDYLYERWDDDEKVNGKPSIIKIELKNSSRSDDFMQKYLLFKNMLNIFEHVLYYLNSGEKFTRITHLPPVGEDGNYETVEVDTTREDRWLKIIKKEILKTKIINRS